MKRSQPLNTLAALPVHLFDKKADGNDEGAPDAEQIKWQGKVEYLEKRPVKKEYPAEEEKKP